MKKIIFLIVMAISLFADMSSMDKGLLNTNWLCYESGEEKSDKTLNTISFKKDVALLYDKHLGVTNELDYRGGEFWVPRLFSGMEKVGSYYRVDKKSLKLLVFTLPYDCEISN